MTPRKRKTQLQEFALLVNIIPFGAAAAKSAAKIRTELKKQGVGTENKVSADPVKIQLA
ncbi:MAG: hypothetical protein WBM69_13085 [Desulfobacterales bacterium]